MNRWRERNPGLALEIDASQQLVDLHREGFHAALRYGAGPWPGLEAERLFGLPTRKIVVGSPAAARRLADAPPEALAREPLLGDGELWARWFKTAGVDARVVPVAIFNDAGLMLQVVEHNLELALSRELLAADALADGRLVQLSPLTITDEPAFTYYLVYPPNLRGWPPLAALRQWLHDELEQSRRMPHPPAETEKKARGKAREVTALWSQVRARAQRRTRRPSRTRSRPSQPFPAAARSTWQCRPCRRGAGPAARSVRRSRRPRGA